MKKLLIVPFMFLACKVSFSQHPVYSIAPDSIAILPAIDAEMSNGLKMSANQNLDKDPKVFAAEAWNSKAQAFKWKIRVLKKTAHQAAVLLQVKGLSPTTRATIRLTVRGAGVSREVSNTDWDKVFFSEPLLLDTGLNELELKMGEIAAGDHPENSLYALEIATGQAWQNNNNKAAALRSRPAWLSNAAYGLFFHWNARSKPISGAAKPYEDAARDFDVTKFASMIHETGADFIILTTSWDLSTFPAPLRSLDDILPGNTTSRDLVADLSDALLRWNIRLLVYCNFRIDKIGWKKEDRLIAGKAKLYFDKLVSIYSEIGSRYAGRIGGVWIDDGMAMYPYNAPFEAITRAIKQKDKDLVVSYNSWIYPRFTDFQDFYGGETGITPESAGIHNKDLRIGGDGYFISGPQQGLKATFCGLMEPGDWTHKEPEQQIPPPLLGADSLISIVKQAMLRKNVPAMNVQVYQDGSISPETFGLLKSLKNAVK